jgi:hypothetical protein
VARHSHEITYWPAAEEALQVETSDHRHLHPSHRLQVLLSFGGSWSSRWPTEEALPFKTSDQRHLTRHDPLVISFNFGDDWSRRFGAAQYQLNKKRL